MNTDFHSFPCRGSNLWNRKKTPFTKHSRGPQPWEHERVSAESGTPPPAKASFLFAYSLALGENSWCIKINAV